MDYKKVMELARERRDAMKESVLKDILSPKTTENWSVGVTVKVVEEWNRHGEGYQNNVNFEFIREDGTSWGSLWYAQFVGPYYSPELKDFISGTITLKDSTVKSLDSMTSQEIMQIMSGRKFRIRRTDWMLRLRNRFNLLEPHEKILLINEIRGRDLEQNRLYLDGGSKYDFMEV